MSYTYQCQNCLAFQYQWNIRCHSCYHDNKKYLETLSTSPYYAYLNKKKNDK